MRLKAVRLAAAFTLALSATVALAHSKPKVMLPAPDSTGPAPAELSVIFTEPLMGKFSKLELTDEKGKVISKESSVQDPKDSKHLTLKLPKLAPGTYYVHWVSAAPDGHRMDGDYSFNVK
jgi:methionine-rich copper-binding protein CopC